MHTVKLPYGKKNDELVHVKVVERGDACGCVCPKCEGALRAAKGEHNIEHFRHVDASECEGAAEFALREKLIELFVQEGQITLPESRERIDGKDELLVPREAIEIESVEVTSGGNEFSPHFLIKTKSANDGEKTIRAVINLGSADPEIEKTSEPIVEIDLSTLGDDYSVERLLRAVVRDTGCIRWSSRPRADARSEELKEEVRRIKTTEAEKARLLREAQKPAHEESIPRVTSGYQTDGFEPRQSKYERRQSDIGSAVHGYAHIDFTCDECGKTRLSYDDMQRFKPGLGTGVCNDCKGIRRESAHLHDGYAEEFKRKSATFYGDTNQFQ